MKGNQYEGHEHRACGRLGRDCAVDYVKLFDDLKPKSDVIGIGYSKNMGMTGIKFIASEKIAVDSFLELHIKIPTMTKSSRIIAKVVRCDREGKGFGIAAAFIWISEADKKSIDGWVKSEKS